MVIAISGGKVSPSPRSNKKVQSEAPAKREEESRGLQGWRKVGGLAPGFMKVM